LDRPGASCAHEIFAKNLLFEGEKNGFSQISRERMMPKVYLLHVTIYIVWGIAATKFQSNRSKIATCAAVKPFFQGKKTDFSQISHERMMPQVCPSFITSFNLWRSAGNRFESDRSKIAACALGRPIIAKSWFFANIS
jgi:hypothetical protein